MKINNLSDLEIWLEQENYTIVNHEAVQQIYDMITNKLNELNLLYNKNDNKLYLELLNSLLVILIYKYASLKIYKIYIYINKIRL